MSCIPNTRMEEIKREGKRREENSGGVIGLNCFSFLFSFLIIKDITSHHLPCHIMMTPNGDHWSGGIGF